MKRTLLSAGLSRQAGQARDPSGGEPMVGCARRGFDSPSLHSHRYERDSERGIIVTLR